MWSLSLKTEWGHAVFSTSGIRCPGVACRCGIALATCVHRCAFPANHPMKNGDEKAGLHADIAISLRAKLTPRLPGVGGVHR
jgi:hypothetical protein